MLHHAPAGVNRSCPRAPSTRAGLVRLSSAATTGDTLYRLRERKANVRSFEEATAARRVHRWAGQRRHCSSVFDRPASAAAPRKRPLPPRPVRRALPTISGTSAQVDQIAAPPPTGRGSTARRRSRTCGFAAIVTGSCACDDHQYDDGRRRTSLVAADAEPHDPSERHGDERRRLDVGRVEADRRSSRQLPMAAAPVNTSPADGHRDREGRSAARCRLRASGRAGRPGYAYAWQRCDADVASCANIAGATGKSYNVTVASLGYRMRVTVTAKNATRHRRPPTRPSPRSSHRSSRSRTTVRRSRSSRPASPAPTVYARFRICDDSRQERHDPRDRLASRRRLVHPPLHDADRASDPCGVYSRHWTPVARLPRSRQGTPSRSAPATSPGLTSLPRAATFIR